MTTMYRDVVLKVILFRLTIIDTSKNTKQTLNEYCVKEKAQDQRNLKKPTPIRLKSITFFRMVFIYSTKSQTDNNIKVIFAIVDNAVIFRCGVIVIVWSLDRWKK